MTHSNISIAVNATEMTIVKIVFSVFFKSGRLETDILPNDLLDLLFALATSRCAFSISCSSSMDESKCLFLTSFPYRSGSLFNQINQYQFQYGRPLLLMVSTYVVFANLWIKKIVWKLFCYSYCYFLARSSLLYCLYEIISPRL